ncbi:MAG: hypothetical protein WAV18_17695, partial [Roseiarcus sp.]
VAVWRSAKCSTVPLAFTPALTSPTCARVTKPGYIMAAGGNAATLRRTMHIHPTVSELAPTIAGELRFVS